MTKTRLPRWTYPGIALSLMSIVLNFASALGASEPTKDAIVATGLIGSVLAAVFAAWKAISDRANRP